MDMLDGWIDRLIDGCVDGYYYDKYYFYYYYTIPLLWFHPLTLVRGIVAPLFFIGTAGS